MTDLAVTVPKAILADSFWKSQPFQRTHRWFDEVSRFLEEHASFSLTLGDFDAIWQNT